MRNLWSYELELALAIMQSSHRRRLPNINVLLSTLGITIGVMILLLTMSIYDGFISQMETIIFSLFPPISIRSTDSLLASKDQDEELIDLPGITSKNSSELNAKICTGTKILSDLSTPKMTLVRSKYLLNTSEIAALQTMVANVAGVTVNAPVIFEDALFRINAASAPMQEQALRILGIQTSVNAEPVPAINKMVATLTLSQLNTLGNAVIATSLYQQLYGSTPSVEHNFSALGALRVERIDANGIVMERQQLKVVGVFSLGVHKIADNLIIVGIDTAQRLLGLPNQASFLGVALTQPYAAESVAELIRTKLSKNKVMVLHWLAVARDLFDSLWLYRRFMLVILIVSVITTVFNIYNNLSIMILDRGRQIGILRALGARKGLIFRIMLIISQIQSLVGVVLGTILGVMGGTITNLLLNTYLANVLPVANASIALKPDVLLLATLVVST